MKILDNELVLDKDQIGDLILKYRWINEIGENEINLIETDSIMADPTVNINGILGINNSLSAPGYGIFHISDFLIKAEDEVNLYHNICGGHLTSGAAAIEFFIPISKQIKFGLIPTFNGKVTIRHADGGYIAKNIDAKELGDIELETVENGVRGVIRLNKKVNFTNNAPVTISFGKDSILVFH
jgi:hypothetical protein